MNNFENKTAIVTEKLLAKNLQVGFAYREEPDRESDSGWRFLAGDEDQTYVDNPDNMSAVSVAEVLEANDGLGVVINSEYGSAFERKGDGFERVTDYDFGAHLDQ